MREVQTAARKHRCQQDGSDSDFLFHDRSRSQMRMVYGVVLGVVGETVGIVELGPMVPAMGDTLGVGITCAALTPRFPI
jgi:hypothetical protein